MEERRIANPVRAVDMFEHLEWGDPGLTIAMVRDEYQLAAEFAHSHQMKLWTNYDWEIARCLFLGINPLTGKPIQDPEVWFGRYKKYGHSEETIRKEYMKLMDKPILQRRLAEHKAAQEAATKQEGS